MILFVGFLEFEQTKVKLTLSHYYSAFYSRKKPVTKNSFILQHKPVYKTKFYMTKKDLKVKTGLQVSVGINKAGNTFLFKFSFLLFTFVNLVIVLETVDLVSGISSKNANVC